MLWRLKKKTRDTETVKFFVCYFPEFLIYKTKKNKWPFPTVLEKYMTEKKMLSLMGKMAAFLLFLQGTSASWLLEGVLLCCCVPSFLILALDEGDNLAQVPWKRH